jgi:hypothetical protein
VIGSQFFRRTGTSVCSTLPVTLKHDKLEFSKKNTTPTTEEIRWSLKYTLSSMSMHESGKQLVGWVTGMIQDGYDESRMIEIIRFC